MAYLEQLAKDVDKLLECPVCLEQIKQPKSLPCQHSFCLDPCITTMAKYTTYTSGRQLIKRLCTIVCALCRKKAYIPEGLNKLPDSLHLKNFLEIRKNTQKQMEMESSMTIRIVYEDQFLEHQGYDLYDPNKITYQEFHVKKRNTLRLVFLNLNIIYTY